MSQLKWIGHAFRMAENRRVKQVMNNRAKEECEKEYQESNGNIEMIGQQRGETIPEMKIMCIVLY